MAKETIVSLVDDISGERADETVAFGFDGEKYEIELTAKNARKLRGQLAAWAASARPIATDEPPRLRSPAGIPGPRSAIERDESEAIRTWGKLNGFPVSVRGPIAFHLVDEYRADLIEIAKAAAAMAESFPSTSYRSRWGRRPPDLGHVTSWERTDP